MTLGACARQQEECRKEWSRTLRRSLFKTRKERQISCALYVHRPLRPFDEPELNCIIISLSPQAIGLSYRDLLYRIAYLKREFESLGVVQDDNVLITIAPSADFFAAILAGFIRQGFWCRLKKTNWCLFSSKCHVAREKKPIKFVLHSQTHLKPTHTVVLKDA